MSCPADPKPAAGPLRLWLPHELLGAGVTRTPAVLQGTGGGVPRGRGLRAEASGRERTAEDALLPSNAGGVRQRNTARLVQGRNPDHKEGPHVTVPRVSERCTSEHAIPLFFTF